MIVLFKYFTFKMIIEMTFWCWRIFSNWVFSAFLFKVWLSGGELQTFSAFHASLLQGQHSWDELLCINIRIVYEALLGTAFMKIVAYGKISSLRYIFLTLPDGFIFSVFHILWCVTKLPLLKNNPITSLGKLTGVWLFIEL